MVPNFGNFLTPIFGHLTGLIKKNQCAFCNHCNLGFCDFFLSNSVDMVKILLEVRKIVLSLKIRMHRVINTPRLESSSFYEEEIWLLVIVTFYEKFDFLIRKMCLCLRLYGTLIFVCFSLQKSSYFGKYHSKCHLCQNGIRSTSN